MGLLYDLLLFRMPCEYSCFVLGQFFKLITSFIPAIKPSRFIKTDYIDLEGFF